MRLSVAEFTPYGSSIMVAVVPSESTVAGHADGLLSKLQPYFPTRPIMLVSVEGNGFRAYAAFQTHLLLALLQLEVLDFVALDLSIPASKAEVPLPF